MDEPKPLSVLLAAVLTASFAVWGGNCAPKHVHSREFYETNFFVENRDDLKKELSMHWTYEGLLRLSEIYEETGHGDALVYANEAIRLNPRDWRGYSLRARHKDAADPDWAEENHEKAMALAPNDPMPVLQRAMYGYRRGGPKSAMIFVNKALKLDPGCQPAKDLAAHCEKEIVKMDEIEKTDQLLLSYHLPSYRICILSPRSSSRITSVDEALKDVPMD